MEGEYVSVIYYLFEVQKLNINIMTIIFFLVDCSWSLVNMKRGGGGGGGVCQALRTVVPTE